MVRELIEAAHDVGEEWPRVNRRAIDLHATSIQLGEIEQAIDQPQQARRIAPHQA